MGVFKCCILYLLPDFCEWNKKSSIGFGTGRKDENGETIFEYPVLVLHPRKDIPSWHWEALGLRPEYGDYWNLKGIGYDVSGFVKS